MYDKDSFITLVNVVRNRLSMGQEVSEIVEDLMEESERLRFAIVAAQVLDALPEPTPGANPNTLAVSGEIN